ncbi:CYFA0S04e03554g1_1 [Cyberlindnera fabianii]|uniref:CYFA0S04e03554g1_1 n=1 Tax=Cyberlindnera fabianii TaxID=36022 RepID=A0A061AZC9_CYBFA|nr:CYFA0S04e03554g1_1 [Cyberlindnera fabianii]
MLRTSKLSLLRSLPGFRQTRGAVCTNIRYIQRSSKEDVVEKYRSKLEQKAKEVGARDIGELKEKLKDTIEEKRKEFAKIDPLRELEEHERKQAELAKQKKATQHKLRDPRSPEIPEAPYKTMNSFVAVDKMKDLTAQEIEFIWRARFQNKDDTLLSIIPTDVFAKLYKNARENPAFVLPLPREGDGMDMHYVQWAFVGPNTVHCMFTTLMEYKVHKEYARPHTTLSFHTELQQDKGVVLMNGTVEKDAAVTVPESQLLLLNVQRFYGAMADTPVAKRRLQLLRDFTAGSSDFTVDKLIEEAQSLEN